MKDVFLLLLILFPTLLFSKDEKSKFFLKVWDDSEFTVVFDNKAYSTPTTKFKLNKVNPGKHRLKIIKDIKGPMGYSAREILFKGSIHIPPSSRVIAKINRHNDLVIVNIIPLKKNMRDSLEKDKRKNVISAIELKKLMSDIEKNKYESDKLQAAKDVIDNNQIKSNQLVDIIALFGFESSKIEFAKYAYPKVINKNQFHKVYDAFIKNNTIKELKQFVKEYHEKHKIDKDEQN
ncbi:MAG: hypothetical protein CSA05_03525 [Bacteroidia bacterium]|nr:MAG: hypothetical protein CSB01_02010 [Bacteroidia bacterium]PIE85865.1 MAG: hypothetical protein CSA05_03525 [Bacteroidia bacterium]